MREASRLSYNAILWCVCTFLLCVCTTGCFGGSAIPDGGADALYGTPPDFGFVCSGNNDGVISRNELQFPVGATVDYLANPAGTTVAVAPDGTMTASGTQWDLTSTAGDVAKLTLEPVSSQWFAASFPDADYAAVTDLASGTLGIFRVTDDALLILGYASPDANKTLLVYDQPIVSLKFPVELGQSWVATAKVVNGTLNGAPYASQDSYKISVDARGTAVLPFLSFDNTLRVHVDLSQNTPGGIDVTRIQYLFFHECYGEIGRMVSNPDETHEPFSSAAEFRRLSL
jgi:hypothetical protein